MKLSSLQYTCHAEQKKRKISTTYGVRGKDHFELERMRASSFYCLYNAQANIHLFKQLHRRNTCTPAFKCKWDVSFFYDLFTFVSIFFSMLFIFFLALSLFASIYIPFQVSCDGNNICEKHKPSSFQLRDLLYLSYMKSS